MRAGYVGVFSVAALALLMLAACRGGGTSDAPSGPPDVRAVTPRQAPNDVQTMVIVRGTGFDRGVRVAVGQHLVGATQGERVTWINEQVVTAVLAPGLAPGDYTVGVTNRDGQFAKLDYVLKITPPGAPEPVAGLPPAPAPSPAPSATVSPTASATPSPTAAATPAPERTQAPTTAPTATAGPPPPTVVATRAPTPPPTPAPTTAPTAVPTQTAAPAVTRTAAPATPTPPPTPPQAPARTVTATGAPPVQSTPTGAGTPAPTASPAPR